jgi:hypothetical protein
MSFANEVYAPYHRAYASALEPQELWERFPEIRSFNELLAASATLKRLYEMVLESQ